MNARIKCYLFCFNCIIIKLPIESVLRKFKFIVFTMNNYVNYIVIIIFILENVLRTTFRIINRT